jgi:hypothetical protein
MRNVHLSEVVKRSIGRGVLQLLTVPTHCLQLIIARFRVGAGRAVQMMACIEICSCTKFASLTCPPRSASVSTLQSVDSAVLHRLEDS